MRFYILNSCVFKENDANVVNMNDKGFTLIARLKSKGDLSSTHILFNKKIDFYLRNLIFSKKRYNICAASFYTVEKSSFEIFKVKANVYSRDLHIINELPFEWLYNEIPEESHDIIVKIEYKW